jgi:ribonuclease HI
MAIGVVIRPGTQSRMFREISGIIPPVEGKSNHYVAEWGSVVAALNLCFSVRGLERIDLWNDNDVVVNQLLGTAKIRKIHLAKLNEEAQRLMQKLRQRGVKRIEFHHEKSRYNSYADSLTQKGLEDQNELDIWNPLQDVVPVESRELPATPPVEEPQQGGFVPKKVIQDASDAALRESEQKRIQAIIDERKKKETKKKDSKTYAGLEL